MRDSSSSSNNRLAFLGGFLLISMAGSAVIAGLSDANKFLPGFNDSDSSTDIAAIFWALFSASLLGLGAVAYKAHANARENRDELNVGVVNVGIPNQDNAEELPLINRSQGGEANNFCKASGWFILGGLTSAAAFLVFSHIARHSAEHNMDFSDARVTTGLIGAVAGVALAIVLTACCLFQTYRREDVSNDQGCWARITSCCSSNAGDGENAGQVARLGV